MVCMCACVCLCVYCVVWYGVVWCGGKNGNDKKIWWCGETVVEWWCAVMVVEWWCGEMVVKWWCGGDGRLEVDEDGNVVGVTLCLTE